MAKLLVRDKNGVEREMTERSFNLAGQKRGWVKVGTVPEPETEVQKIMREKREERAAQQANQQPVVQQVATTTDEVGEQKPEPKKRGPKSKNTEA